MRKLVAAILVTTAFATAAFAAETDIQAFEKKVGKVGGVLGKDKGLCTCLDDASFFFGAAGFLRRSEEEHAGENLVIVRCVIQGFDPMSGALDYQAGCLPWAPLAR
jgi:hypothetical protein